MKDDAFKKLIDNLTAHAPEYEVRIDTDMAHGVGATARAASDAARVRLEALRRGDRVVHVIENGRTTVTGIVHRSQGVALIAAGAKYVGPEQYAPPANGVVE